MLERYAYLFWQYRKVRRFLAQAANARRVQRQVLLEKLNRHRDSDFGRVHGFAEIRSVADFRRHVPITDYEYYGTYIERLKRGELESLYGPDTRLLMFALTSGTTAETKYIPVTQQFFDEYRAGWNLWGLKVYRDHLDLVRKKTIKLASDWQQSFTPGGTPCGNISGLVEETAPWAARTRFLLPKPIIKIAHARSKHYTALRLALASTQVGMIGTANPSTLVEFARLADAERAALVRDIHDGTLSAEVQMPAAVRELLLPWTGRRNPRRARQLEAIVERTGHLWPQAAWPNLSLLAVWLGGSVGIYLPQVRQYYGDVAVRDHGLSASEAHMTVPIADGTSAGVLEYPHHFFEFIPVAERESRQPTVLEAHELERDRDYFILLTTSSGFYRYDIQDVVRCVDYCGAAPVLVFQNKGKHFSSVTGEKLNEAQVVAAVTEATREMGIVLEHFTVAPVMGERPGYVLLVEPGPHAGREDELARRIDQCLAAANWEYANRLESNRLVPLVVREVPPGTWRDLRTARTAARGNFEEYKHPCLVGDLAFVARLLGTVK